MNIARLETLSMRPKDPATQSHDKAVEVANTFEQLFVRSLVSSMRATASMGGESGMFGDGPGASTYTDWFDENVAQQVSASGRVGITEAIIADLERHGELPKAAALAKSVSEFRPLDEKLALKGGIDGLH